MNTPHTEANNIDATTATTPRTETILTANPQPLLLDINQQRVTRFETNCKMRLGEPPAAWAVPCVERARRCTVGRQLRPLELLACEPLLIALGRGNEGGS
jgi:hypothetical protein